MIAAKTRLTLDNRPKRGDVLGLSAAPDFQMRVTETFNEIGRVRVAIHGTPFYANYTELIQGGAFYLHPRSGR